mgnify:CR=1 FL=1
MAELKKIFFNKKILIYGLGVSGNSTFNYLKKNNDLKVYDDNIKKINFKKFKNFFINKNKIIHTFFDYIVISPGINSKKCSLKKFLDKNKNKICTDLDIFYVNNPKNQTIAVTGTNGKSTTVKLITDILKNDGRDARSVGNIGKSILNERNIKKNTFFVIEASSYQIEYSKFFKSKYSILLNINPDHIDRHGSFRKYLQAKLKLFNNTSKKDYALFNSKNSIIKNAFKKKKLECNIINVNQKINNKYNNSIQNNYFFNQNNQENLSFVFKICEKIKISKKVIIKTINNFQGLNYRQQIIYNSKKLLIINDSKSTSFSSTINLINSHNNIFWILGGLPKKNDKFNFKKNKHSKIQAYIFGKSTNFFIKKLKNKIEFQVFQSLKEALKKTLIDIKNSNISKKKTILFSPSSASFDEYKNFEQRGAYFNFLVKSMKYKL